MPNPTLREKFKKECFVRTTDTFDDVLEKASDWWLFALTSELEGVSEKIKDEKEKHEPSYDPLDDAFIDGCNTALAIITTSLEGIKK